VVGSGLVFSVSRYRLLNYLFWPLKTAVYICPLSLEETEETNKRERERERRQDAKIIEKILGVVKVAQKLSNVELSALQI